ncbi:hypothetical protein WBJ53_23695 [Spirosoma sp. SC4-14]|uniref:hypothetical protein n=1 Tax=Spirosoma sp. SC4-14 TaxID=3128900 RepID=UPI0030D369E1
MKINLLLLLFLFASSEQAVAQVLADDAEGKSSIVQYSNSINFDLAKTALSVGFNNYRHFKIADQQTLWGISANAKNSDGIATLFNEGKFQPESRLQFFVGNRKRIKQNGLGTLEEERDKLVTNSARTKYIQLLNFRPAVDTLIKKQANLTNAQKKALADTVRAVLKKNRDEPIPALETLQKSYPVKDSLKAVAIAAVVKLITERQSEAAKLDQTINQLDNRLLEITAQILKLDTIRKFRLLYVSGGLNAASFQTYDSSIMSSLDKRFVKTPYRGGFIDLGINYDYKANWLLGASIGYERANTLADNLKSKDYTVRTVDTLGKQQLISETKYTGYTGDFRLYDRVNIRTDLLYFHTLDKMYNDTSGYQLAWNILYTRSFISFDQKAAKSRIDIGSALNFYNVKKGNFLGGLYLEITDLTNSQKADTNAFQRLSFGIVAKYAFQSIINRFSNS